MNHQQLKEKFDKTLSRFENMDTYSEHGTLFEQNVKIRNAYFDHEKHIDELTESDTMREKLKNYFTDERCNDIYEMILEMERDYVSDMISGCQNSSRDFWEKEIEKKQTEEEKEQCKKDMEKDLREANMYKLFKSKKYYFTGRSGGHFVSELYDVVQDYLCDSEKSLAELKRMDEDGYFYEDDTEEKIERIIKEQEEEIEDYLLSANEYMDCVDFVFGNVRAICDGIPEQYKEQVKEKIDEELDNFKKEEEKAKDLQEAKEKAEKHGYFLAQKL